MPFIPEIVTLADVPRYQARERPDAVAMIDGDRVTTYGDWNKRCARIANGLTALGLKPGTRVAAIDRNSDTYFDILFGTAMMGGVLVSINWRLAAPEIAYVLNDAGAQVLFINAKFARSLKPIRSELKALKHIIVMEGEIEGWTTYETWALQQSDADPAFRGTPQTTVMQMYTSGTTGHPKGVELSHFSLYATTRNVSLLADSNPELIWNKWNSTDVSLVTMPNFHVGGTGWGVGGLYNGAKSVILSQFEAGAVLDAIEKHRISKLILPPAAIHMLLQHPECRETDLSSIKFLLYAASPIPLDLLREAVSVFKCGFVQLYGMTETAGAVTYLPAGDHELAGNKRMRSAGKPLPGIKIEIRDAAGKPTQTGAEGEICIYSDARMNGYWNLPEETANTMSPDGWVRSGDAGYVDEDGYVYVQDRVKDMIVSGGENIYPAEVESAIYGSPGVAEVAVIGVPSEEWGEAVKAIIVLKPGVKPDTKQILEFTRSRIAGYKTPKSIDFVEALPRNAAGKVLKRELRKAYWEGRERQVN